MKVKTDDNKIILTDLPIVEWLSGLVFLLGGLSVVIPGLLSLSWSGAFAALFGSIFVFTGYQIGVCTLYRKITIDRQLKTITVKKIGLRHSSEDEYTASEIKKIYSETDSDSEDTKYYAICLALNDGETVVLGTTFRSKAECEAVISTTREYFKQVKFSEFYQPKYLDSSIKFSKRKMNSR